MRAQSADRALAVSGVLPILLVMTVQPLRSPPPFETTAVDRWSAWYADDPQGVIANGTVLLGFWALTLIFLTVLSRSWRRTLPTHRRLASIVFGAGALFPLAGIAADVLQIVIAARVGAAPNSAQVQQLITTEHAVARWGAQLPWTALVVVYLVGGGFLMSRIDGWPRRLGGIGLLAGAVALVVSIVDVFRPAAEAHVPTWAPVIATCCTGWNFLVAIGLSVQPRTNIGRAHVTT